MAKYYPQMLMEMELRNLRPKTIKAYVRHVAAFAKMFGKSLADMGEMEIRQYLHHLRTVKKVSSSNINIAYAALRFFYVHTLHRDWSVEKIPRTKKEKRLPVVLSPEEVQAIINAIPDLKHRVMVMATYSGGLRVSETANLKVTDIDSQRGLIRVDQGKGRKDRYTLLSDTLLHNLRDYYKAYRPKLWLFEGKRKDGPVGVETIQRAFRFAKKKPGSRSRPPSIPCVTALPLTC